MWRLLLIVGLGGMLGTMFRFGATILLVRQPSGGFPYATLWVNIIGCFFIGVFYSLASRYEWMNNEWKFFLTAGFCGGLTTFSAFAYENLALIQQGKYGLFLTYGLCTFLGTMMAVAAGVLSGKLM